MADPGVSIPEWAVLWQQLLQVLTMDGASATAKGSQADAASGASQQTEAAWHEFGAALTQQLAAGTASFTQSMAQSAQALNGLTRGFSAGDSSGGDSSAVGDGGVAGSGPGAVDFSPAFALPPIGLWQRDVQAANSLHEATGDFLELQGAYAARINEMLADAVRLLTARIRQQRNDNAAPHDARQIYDQWVIAGEECFARLAHEPQFCALQARLINALSALRRQQQQAVEPALHQLGLPTRADVDALHAQLAALRAREHAAVCAGMAQPAGKSTTATRTAPATHADKSAKLSRAAKPAKRASPAKRTSARTRR